ncbi:GDSL-type esterase/lipase family protein [Chondromyces crocatus]|uniref:GDSL-type esterase/lipase family protein n=1 Tax=Chondromyces crocatus TaxID=52 RepID=UPI00067DAA95|nr:GDSL-type esterase/lipase family protein [Chondromyces crocatus]
MTPQRRVCAVAAIGDSLTDARSGGGKFLETLRQRCPESRFDNYGKGGDMVNQMRRRFLRDVLGSHGVGDKPALTHVIVFGGVNDLYSDKTAFRTVPKIQADLSTMYAEARQRGARVVAMTVAPWGGFTRYYTEARGETTRQLNEWIRGRKEAGEVDQVVDAFALLSCGKAERLCPEYTPPFMDGLHFGTKGHEVLGQALYEAAFSECR